MKCTSRILTFGVLAFASPLTTEAAPPSQRADTPNAALVYWQAFASMPRLMDTKTGERIIDASSYQTIDKPVDDELRKFLEQPASRYSLHMLHRAAKIEHCEWGLDLAEDGGELLLPHVLNARHLMRLSLLRARDHFEHGRHIQGIDDVIDTMLLARHAGSDGVTVSLLASFSIESTAGLVVAAYLPKMPPESLDLLAKQLAALPAPAVMSRTLANEQYLLDWFISRYESADPTRRLRLCRNLTGSDEEAKTLASADVLKLATELRPLFADIPHLSSLPLDRLETAAKTQVDPKVRSNPLGKVLFPQILAARRGEAVNQCRNLLLVAAVDVARRGPAALKDHRDPFGDGPFAYAAYDGGFELTSRLEFLPHKPIGLRAGIRPGHLDPEGTPGGTAGLPSSVWMIVIPCLARKSVLKEMSI